MECQSCTDTLTAHVDGELGLDLAQPVEEHLEECQRCMHEYQSLLACTNQAEKLPSIQPDPILWANISAQISTFPLSQNSWKDLFLPVLGRPWIPVSAGALGVAIVSVILLQPPDSTTREALMDYVQTRNQIELQHGDLIQNAGFQKSVIPSTNPFRSTLGPVQINPFSKEP